MRMAVTDAPCNEDSSTRRSALPSVMPKPRSSGSSITVAVRSGSAPISTDFCVSISERQFLSSTITLSFRQATGKRRADARAGRSVVQTRRRFRGRQPLCGIGVTSLMEVT